MKQIDLTPHIIFEQLRRTVTGQDDYLQALSNAAWLHQLRYQHFMDGANIIEKPKQNLLVIGNSGTGKTLAVQTLGKILNLPVIIEDASSLTGEGWRGKSVSHICERIHRATDKAEDKVYSIVCFDEIDKVFRSNRTNASGAADSGFLPINNLLTFLAGGMITCTDNNSRYSIDSTNFLIICLGAFDEDLPGIIKKRLMGTKQIGFCTNGSKEPDMDDLLQYVTEEDLHEYGIPWEFLGRLNLITRTRQLDVSDYKRILTQSDASPVSQYHHLLSSTSGIRVSITDAAVKHIADKAAQSNEGARMLARIVAETLQPAIFDIGQDPDLDGIEIDCNNSGLFTRSEYDIGQKEVNTEPFCYIGSDLSEVPLICTQNRGEILLLTEKIKKSSPKSWMLPDVYVAASTCVIAAAICSLLLDTNDSDKNMLMLYDQIDQLSASRIRNPDSQLTLMINEFTEKAQKDIDFEKAKTNARQFIEDYCRNYSSTQNEYSA